VSDTAERPADPRIGVYVCHCGGNISDVVDVEAVTDQVGAEGDVVVARHVPFLCSDEGQTAIERDIAELGLDRVVIAACTPSLHETTFRRAVARAGLNPFLYQHANIREQVSWAHVHDHAAATDKAYRIVRAAIAKAASLRPLDKVRADAVHRALVLGGGVAGLRAALDLARWGMPVVLVERSAELGGNVLRLRSTYPTDESGRALIERLVADVRAEPLVDLRLRTEVIDVSGFVGDFHVTLRSTDPTPDPDDGTHDEEVGAIVLATGFIDYEPAPGEYGFGGPRVVTLAAYQDRLSGTGSGTDLASALTLDGPIRSVAFLHCVGSRQVQGVDEPNGELNTYCSRVCCTATLRAAAETRRRFPDVRVVDVYRDLRTYARDQEEVYRAASDAGVLFVRVPDDERARVETSVPGDPYPLLVRTRDALTFGSELELPVDLVVLATGMKPGGVADVVSMTKVPTGADGFLLEVHPKLRPVESAIPGILLAGTARGPMDIAESTTSASAAAAKVATLLAHDQVEMDPFVAKVDPARCTGTGECLDACRYAGAIGLQDVELDDGLVVKRAYVNPVACKGCGACVAVCPSGAIDVQGWEISQYLAMVDAIVAEPTPEPRSAASREVVPV
jgi:heterodisulfide reductase subunit A2